MLNKLKSRYYQVAIRQVSSPRHDTFPRSILCVVSTALSGKEAHQHLKQSDVSTGQKAARGRSVESVGDVSFQNRMQEIAVNEQVKVCHTVHTHTACDELKCS